MLPVLRTLPRLVGTNIRQSVRRMATESGSAENGGSNLLLVVGVTSMIAASAYIVFSDDFWFNVPIYPDPEKVRPDKHD